MPSYPQITQISLIENMNTVSGSGSHSLYASQSRRSMLLVHKLICVNLRNLWTRAFA